MNITIFGATGMVGTRLVAEAAGRGHQVVAASRQTADDADDAVTTMSVDVALGHQVDVALAKADAAVLAIRAEPGREAQVPALTVSALDATARAGVPLLIIGGAGPLSSPRDPEVLVIDDPAYVPAAWREVASASLAQLRACAERPNRDWVYLSPPAVLEPGTRSGSYRRGTTTLLTADDGTSRISAEDLAVAAIDELEHPGTDRHITVL